ncbi:MAG: RHS repeat protein, partial [Candidatus Omnitrophica bacterium]|nr:RHS repeat protein [Candidatus Omnitrophota bacterium]
MEDPDGNQTSFTYNLSSGRKSTETNAMGKVTRFDYNDRGQLTRTWGNAAYPARYVYDPFGRLHEMHTWQSGTNWNDVTWPTAMNGLEDVTTWNYQDSTGLLTSKVDDSTQSVLYTYTYGGRLKTRTWARSSASVVTTYDYDPDTAELIEIDYSDSTPDITFTYDRLGRQDSITDALGGRDFDYSTGLQL